MAKKTAFDAWSYSRLAAYEQCPLQAKLKFLDQIKEEDSPAMQRGSEIHKALAEYITQKAEGLPRECFQHPVVEGFIGELAAFPDKIVETQWGYDAGWQPVGWFDGPAGKTWFRSILDAGVLYEDSTAEAIDWKTGKRYGSNMDQMKSQAVAMFARFKQLVKVTVRLVYVDEKDHKASPYEIADIAKHEIPSIKADFEKRVGRMFNDKIFAPKPNDKCRFCAFSKNKGGQCAFG